jgi:hypothetical protein
MVVSVMHSPSDGKALQEETSSLQSVFLLPLVTINSPDLRKPSVQKHFVIDD